MKRFTITSTLLAIIAGTQLGATDCGQVTRDSGFDLWCGSDLCVWKIVRGDAQRIGTWHESDSGVLLLGNDAAISQLTPVNSSDASCIHFEVVADVDENADAYLDVDLEGDGRIERHEPIPAAHWRPLSFLISINGPYDGVRFELGKRGPGRSAFARIDAHTRDPRECAGLPTIVAAIRDNGASCSVDADCRSNQCVPVVTAPTPPADGGWVGTGNRRVRSVTSAATAIRCSRSSAAFPIASRSIRARSAITA